MTDRRLRRVVAHVAGEPRERQRLGRLDAVEHLAQRAQQEGVDAVEQRVAGEPAGTGRRTEVERVLAGEQAGGLRRP